MITFVWDGIKKCTEFSHPYAVCRPAIDEGDAENLGTDAMDEADLLQEFFVKGWDLVCIVGPTIDPETKALCGTYYFKQKESVK